MLSKLSSKLLKSIWLLPAIYSVTGLVLAVIIVLIDTGTIGNVKESFPQYLFTDIGLAKDIQYHWIFINI
jgi:hypothetical protein